jgi:Glycosyltransferase family 87
MPMTHSGLQQSTATGESKKKSRPKYYLRDFLLGILPILLLVQFLGWLTFLPNALRGYSDFRQLYVAGYILRTGQRHQLYDYSLQTKLQNTLVSSDERALPFIRPAYQALLFVPFSYLKYRAAYLAFLSFNILILWASFWVLRPEMKNLFSAWRGLPLGLFLGFYPVALALMQGQDSIILLLLLSAALTLLRRNRDIIAGFLLGIGLFKFQIVLPIALLFLIWRRWRFSAGFVISAALVSLLSLLLVGWTEMQAFARSLFSVGAAMPGSAGHMNFPLRVTIMANLRGLIYGLCNGWLPGLWIQVLTIAISVLTLVWVALWTPRKQDGAHALVLAITASVVVSYYLFIHDLSVLLVPIAVTLNRFVSAGGKGNDSFGQSAGSLSALLIVAPMFVFLIPGYFYFVSLPILMLLSMLMASQHKDAHDAHTLQNLTAAGLR